MLHLLTSTCVIDHVTGHTVDENGTPIPSTTAVTVDCYIQPTRRNAEGHDFPGELTVEQRWRIWWPAGTIAEAGDKVTVTDHDTPFVVDNSPEAWVSPDGTRSYIAADLRQIR